MTLLVLGGRSEIGSAIAERLAAGTVVLASRPGQGPAAELAARQAAQRVRSAGADQVVQVAFDADDVATHAAVLARVAAEHGPLTTVVLAFGVLGEQKRAETDAAHALAIVHTDFVAQVSVLTHLAAILRAQGSGTIVVVSSVAGVRVRRANYVYGAAKAGLDGFACGLSDALAGSGVRLLLVRPGFVIGRMTAGMRPAPLATTAPRVADAVVAGLAAGRRVVWVPASLRALALLMRLLPRPVWRRLPR